MLRITVEIVPFGDELRSRVIGKGWISNDGTGNNNSGNYNCTFIEKDRNVEYDLKLKNFDRKMGFWKLIREALKKI
ncbi:MAG: hypothetical protein ACOCP4_04125 [Candidatus Woesearchaeota archaeon]